MLVFDVAIITRNVIGNLIQEEISLHTKLERWSVTLSLILSPFRSPHVMFKMWKCLSEDKCLVSSGILFDELTQAGVFYNTSIPSYSKQKGHQNNRLKHNTQLHLDLKQWEHILHLMLDNLVQTYVRSINWLKRHSGPYVFD